MNLKAIAAIVLLVLYVGSMLFAYSYGRNNERLKTAKAIEQYRQNEDKLLTQLQAQAIKREVVTQTRLKVIHDASGSCLDQSIPADLLGSMHDDRAD